MKKAFLAPLALTLLLGVSPAAYCRTSPEKDFYRVIESGDFESAEELAAAASPSEQKRLSAWLALYRGDYKTAAVLAAPSDPQKDFLANYSAYMAGLAAGFIQKESDGFIIRYFPDDAIMADFALQRLEKIRSSAAAIFGYAPPEKVLVEIYPDKNSFAAASTLGAELLEKSGTVGICKFNRLMILSPRNLALGYAWVDTLAHEYSHFVVNRVSEYNCPLWAHEGLARWTDTLWRSDKPLYLSDYSASRLSAAAKSGKLIAFDKMAPSLVYLPTKDDISLAFAQAASFVDFIVAEYGLGVIPEWLDGMKKSDEKKALSRVTSGSFAKIERGWRKRIAALAAPSSTGLPDLPRYELRSEEELIPSDIMRRARLGDEFRRRGNYAAALSQYERAYAAGKNPVVAVKVARAMLALGRADEAEGFIRAVSDGNRGYVTPHLVLAEIAAARLDRPSAREHYENAFMINPFHPGLYDALKSLNLPH